MGRPGSHHSPSAPCVAVPRLLSLSEFRLPALHLGTVSGCDMCGCGPRR